MTFTLSTGVIVGHRPARASLPAGARASSVPTPTATATTAVVSCFQLPDGTCWTDMTQLLQNNAVMYKLAADFMGRHATAHISYGGDVFVRGGPKHYSGAASGSIYGDGAKANIAEFYRTVTAGKFDNATAHRSVDSHLTAIWVVRPPWRGVRLTMDELLKENRKLKVDLTG